MNITTEGVPVLQLLQELDPNKSAGPDGTASNFLKDTTVGIAPALTLIHKASLHPASFTRAPVYKKTLHTNPPYYRPMCIPG